MALKETIKQSLENARANGYDVDAMSVNELADDLVDYDAEVDEYVRPDGQIDMRRLEEVRGIIQELRWEGL